MPVLTKSLLLPVALGNWIDYHPLPRTQYSKIKPTSEQDQLLKRLQGKHLELAEKLCALWAEQLKLPIQIYSLNITAFTYGEFIDANDREAPVAQLELAVDSGWMHWYFDYGLAQALLDRIVGGRGYLGKRPEAMTSVEAVAFQTFLEESSSVFSKTWGWAPRFAMDALKTPKLVINSQINNQEPYYLVSFEVKLGQEAPARITLAYTEKALEQLQSKWNGMRSASANLISIKPQTAQKIMVPMTVSFGTAEARLREVAELQMGDIIVLRSKPEDPVKVVLGDQAKLLATPGQRGRNWSVQIQAYENEESVAADIVIPKLEENEMFTAQEPLKSEMDFMDQPAEQSVEEQTAALETETESDSIWDDDDDFSWDDDTDNK